MPMASDSEVENKTTFWHARHGSEDMAKQQGKGHLHTIETMYQLCTHEKKMPLSELLGYQACNRYRMGEEQIDDVWNPRDNCDTFETTIGLGCCSSYWGETTNEAVATDVFFQVGATFSLQSKSCSEVLAYVSMQHWSNA